MHRVGEALPKFPTPTHGDGPGLRPFNYIWDATSRIPVDADFHLGSVKKYDPPRPAYDPKVTRAPCLTTSGPLGKDGKLVAYFDGTRQLTLREVAALNGFDHTWKMPEDETTGTIIKMIGNSVPPSVWEKFMRMIEQSFTDFDTGKINEAGLPVTACRDSLATISGNTSLRGQLRRASIGALTLQRSRARSRTLSPDLQSMGYATLGRPATGTTGFGSNDSPSSRKRKAFISVEDDNDDEPEVVAVTKDTAKMTIDLTGED
jgi:hypothetical protein